MIHKPKRTKIVSSLAIFYFMFASSVLGQGTHWSQSLALIYDNGLGDTMPYRLFVPPDYESERAYPLVVFLHGAGERGTNNTSQVAVHIDNLINATQSPQYTSFLVAPQTQSDWGSNLSVSLVDGILTEIEENYSIDATRLYITGLSMGGFGTFDQLYYFPERFAAAAPLSGGVPSGLADEMAAVIKDIPIWVQHGAQDTVVSVSLSQNIVIALYNAGASPLYTEYPNRGHNIWSYVYADQNNKFYPWMFSQSLDGLLLEPMLLGLQSPPDFNGDSHVDLKDLTNLIEHWDQNEPLLDIVPMPAGDGIVDALDLEAMMHFWLQDINDPTLIYHWALDETEGDIAHNPSGDSYNGTVFGDSTWHPDGGAIDGALQFDGVDDRVDTPATLNPVGGPFSVFAWVKSDTASRVILSQSDGHNWLLTDSAGALMTDLKGSGRKAKALHSQTVIADGQWHRVGLTWDDRRTLYVDDVSVAEDEPALPPDVSESFRIGAGANLESGTFFSGLIDDVRIYNRAVRP
jgi:poly(3-hydroxybutyrate) depolymerase